MTGTEQPPREPMLPRAAVAAQGLPAGLVSRGLAVTVDGVVVVGLTAGVVAGLTGAAFLLSPGWSFPSNPLVQVLPLSFGVAVIYLTQSWSNTGRTYGDALLGLRVVSRGGGRIGFVRSLARAVFCLLLPIGLLGAAAGRRHRSLQDVVLRTAVVYDWAPRVPAG